MRYIPIVLLSSFLLLTPSEGRSHYPDVSLAIDQFVSKIYPKGSHYFWVINNKTSEFSQELIVDINTFLQTTDDEKSQPNRFLLLIVNGELKGAQNIPLGAEVDCRTEKET